MNIRIPGLTKRRCAICVVALLAAGCVVAGTLTRDRWLPKANELLAAVRHNNRDESSSGSEPAAHGTACAESSHPGHDETNSLRLSEQARKNVGLKLVTIELDDFDRTITVPAMVVERPGRTRIKV